MGIAEAWNWLGTVFEYFLAVFCILAVIFFLLAVLKKDHARRYGFVAAGCGIWAFLTLFIGTAGNATYSLPEKSAMGTFQLSLSIIFLITAGVLVYFAFEAKNKVHKKEAYYSTLLAAVLFVIMGIYILIPSSILFFGEQNISTWQDLVPFYSLTFPFPIGRVVITIVPLVLIAIGVYTLKEMKSKKYETESAQEADKYQKTHVKLDLEISRKIYHVVIIVVLICYLFVGNIVLDSIYQFALFGLPQHPSMPPSLEIYDNIIGGEFGTGYFGTTLLNFRAGHLLLLTAITWIMYILLFTDLVRIKHYRYYPFKDLAKIYREKERRVLAPHIYLTVGCLFTVMLSMGIDQALMTPAGISAQIVMITIMVSALADAVATLIGITKGKRHLKGGKSPKTWEGLIAGIISAFFLGLLSFLALMPQYGGNIGQAIILSLIAAGVFGLIDYLSPPISDNILNPVAISLVLWGVSLLFFI